MQLSLSNVPDPRDAGEGCTISSRLSAFHDGELDAATASAVQEHLATCASCATELEEIRALSQEAKSINMKEISAVGINRIHRTVDADDRYAIFRIATVLTGLAASVMVVGSVWLKEFPASEGGKQIVVIPGNGPDWSRVAVNLQVDPLPRSAWEVNDGRMLQDERLAQWMVDGLTGRPR